MMPPSANAREMPRLRSSILSAMPPPPPQPSLGRVLIIDDEPAVGGMVLAVLTEFGYAVKHAGGGVEGLRLIRLFEPNVVLLDLKMPGMSGLEVLDYLRRDYPEIPVVILSGNEDASVALATLRGGAFDYIQKPFNIDVLARVVAAAIGSALGGRRPSPRTVDRPPHRRPRLPPAPTARARTELLHRWLDTRTGLGLVVGLLAEDLVRLGHSVWRRRSVFSRAGFCAPRKYETALVDALSSAWTMACSAASSLSAAWDRRSGTRSVPNRLTPRQYVAATAPATAPNKKPSIV